MVQKTLSEGGNVCKQVQRQRHDLRAVGTNINDSTNVQHYGFQHSDTNHQIRVLIDEIISTPDEDHLEGIRQPLPGTCDCILEKPLYTQWETGSCDAVLFVQCGLGWSKSVLARFIIERLLQQNRLDENALIIISFARAGKGETRLHRLWN